MTLSNHTLSNHTASSNPYYGRVDNDKAALVNTSGETLMCRDNSHREIIDSCLLRPTSRALVILVMRLLTHWDFTLAITCFAIASGYFLLVLVTHHIFWDINFYSAVVKAMAAGKSPYDNGYIYRSLDVGYSSGFVYPPLVAEAFYKLRWLFLTSTGRALLISAHIMSWISIPFMLATRKRIGIRATFYMFGAFINSFWSWRHETVGCRQYSRDTSCCFDFLDCCSCSTRTYELFWVTIFLCSLVKFTFLGFLLVPIILDKKYISAILFIAAVIAAYALNYLITPALFSEYLAQILGQHSNSGYLGLSIFSLATALIKGPLSPNGGHIFAIAISIHLVFVAIVVLLAFAIAERRGRPKHFDLFCGWLVVSGFLISPRIFDYDLAIVIVPIVLLTRMLLTERGLGIGVAVIVAGLGFILLRTPSLFETPLSEMSATFTIVGVWMGAAVQWLTADTKSDLAQISKEIPS